MLLLMNQYQKIETHEFDVLVTFLSLPILAAKEKSQGHQIRAYVQIVELADNCPSLEHLDLSRCKGK